jgi:hypothetical protein
LLLLLLPALVLPLLFPLLAAGVVLVVAEEDLKEDKRFCAEDLRRIMVVNVNCKGRADLKSNQTRAAPLFTRTHNMADFNAIAHQFTEFYYSTFDTNRANLAPLYRDTSMLTFEGNPFQGAASIVEKLTSLPFEKVRHQVTTRDAQPSTAASLIVSVTGQLLVDDSPNPLQFSQVFHLIPEGGSYYVLNDIFRLNYG